MCVFKNISYALLASVIILPHYLGPEEDMATWRIGLLEMGCLRDRSMKNMENGDREAGSALLGPLSGQEWSIEQNDRVT